ncbi:TonB-dependent siderophore receptor [Halopseudomonas maritima]|uniref:TonB-dependent siderophore receptor n=1 Tax=Halopseudomonas maritima TaxID=2918528 RepID=UPI001EECAA5A|nr:TonB-dependent siderophore receptor [Halopseudomonas maritima]UJJ32214.1 TonB-dependent siderophore receptor [Halopseudomonas maritima]
MSADQTRRGTRIPHYLSPLSLAVAVAFSPALTAAEEDNSDELALPTMQVWGTEVSSSSEFLADQDISVKQADHLSDLLRDLPGVDVGGTHSVNQRINIRGLNETDLDIRLDGASQYASMFHHIGNLTLNPDIIQMADVQVGNNSVRSAAVGGAVYFETKNAKDLLRAGEDVGLRVYGGYGSNDYRQGSATVYGRLSDKVDAMLYGFQIDRDNFDDGDGNQTIGSDGKVSNMLLKFGVEPSFGHRFELSHDHYRDKGDYSPRPDMSGSANNSLTAELVMPTEYTRDTTTLRYQYDAGDNTTANATLYRNAMELNRDESGAGRWPANRQSDNTAEAENLGATLELTSLAELAGLQHEITYGALYNRHESRAQYGSDPWVDENTVSTAGYIEDRIQLTDRLTVTPGVRYDHFKRNAETGSDTFSDVTWALATDFAVTDNLTLFASARELYKPPQLLETFIYYQSTTTLADDIKEQTGLNKEVGARFQQQFGAHRVSANLTLFQTDLDDYFVNTFSAAQDGYIISNSGDVEIEGFEASVGYGIDEFNSRLSYAKSDADNVTTNGPALNAMSRSMDVGDSVALSLSYYFPAVGVETGWNSQWVMSEDNVVAGQEDKAAYDVHSLYAQWVPAQMNSLTLTFGVDNLFDEQYYSHASTVGSVVRGGNTIELTDFEPGRNIKVSAAYQF